MNYFEVFELPQCLAINTKDLERRFHQLSRQHHPDFFSNAPADEKSRALRMTALLNDAYRTLRHPVKRVEYLLTLHGLKSDGSKVPQALLMEVFEINEQLEDIRMAGDADQTMLEKLRQQVHAKRERFEREMEQASAQWDELLTAKASERELKSQLSKLAEVLSESSYIRNLEDEIEGRQSHYFKGSH